MKKLLIILILFIPGLVMAEDFQTLLDEADSLVNYPGRDFAGQYTIVQDKPGQGRTTTIAAIFRRDSEDTYVIVIQEPSVNKGQGYLKQGRTLWFYDPESKRFNSTASTDRFQNSNARNSDFTQSTLAQDYDVVSGTEVKLGSFDCWLLELEANNTEVTYPKMKIWISKDGLVRMTEDYSLSGQHLRTTAISGYYNIKGTYVPKVFIFEDQLRGANINGQFHKERTLVEIARPSFEALPNSVFSKSFLESVNR